MARKQKATKSEKKQDAEFRAKVRRAVDVATTATSVLMIVGLIAGLSIGRRGLIRDATKLKSQEVKVEFQWPPLAVPPGGSVQRTSTGTVNTWLDAASRRKLERVVLSGVTNDPFDLESLKKTQEELMATGWFASPCRVERDTAGIVHVSGEWRQPVAAVRWGDHDYVVSAQGERLDAKYAPEASGLKAVIGPAMDPPILGDVWLGGDVQAGLALLEYLKGMPGYHQVAAVDVSQYNAKKRLLIVTDRGSQIVWGGRPGEFAPGQAKDTMKRTRLASLFRESGRIDKGEDVLNISLSNGY